MTKKSKINKSAVKRVGYANAQSQADSKSIRAAMAKERERNKLRNMANDNALTAGAGGGSIPRVVASKYNSYGRPVGIPGHAELVYSALGATDEGRQYSLVNLHPCGEFVAECNGIPDYTQTSVATPTFRSDSVVGWNAALFATPPTPIAPFRFDVQVVVLPHAELDYAFRLRYDNVWSKWEARYSSYFAANNDGSAVTLAASGYSTHRVVGRGTTVHFDAPRLADQGRLIAGQVKPVVRDSPMYINGSGSGNASVGATTIVAKSYYVPQTETELTAQDPLAAQWEARCGTYIPHRYIQPTQDFVPVNGGNTISAYNSVSETVVQIPNSIVTFAQTATIDPTIGNNLQDWYNPNATWSDQGISNMKSPGKSVWGLSDPMNNMTSVQFFLGISNEAQLHVKSRLHLEAEAHANSSPVTPFLHKSPTLDEIALSIVAKVAQNSPHVYFAADNDLSGILMSIGKILPSILGPVGRALESTGIPIISDIGQVGRRLATGLQAGLA